MPRTRVSCWDQGFGCWEFSDMAWVIKKWRRGRACRGAARAASVGKCRSRCVRCMCGRAACAVCRRPAWRRGRRARAAHKYRSPAGGLFLGNGSYNSLAEQRALCAAAPLPRRRRAPRRLERNQNKCSKPERSSGSSSAAEHYCSDGCSNATDATAAATGRCSCAAPNRARSPPARRGKRRWRGQGLPFSLSVFSGEPF